MRKVFLDKWLVLAVLLILSLSTFSFVAYKKSRSVCNMTKNCCENQSVPSQKGEMIWDAVSHQFTSFVRIR